MINTNKDNLNFASWIHKFFTDKLHFDLVLWLVTSVKDFTWNISSTESRQPKGHSIDRIPE